MNSKSQKIAAQAMLAIAGEGYEPEFIVAQWVASIAQSAGENVVDIVKLYGEAMKMTVDMLEEKMEIWPELLPGPGEIFVPNQIMLGGVAWMLDEYWLMSWSEGGVPMADDLREIVANGYKAFRYVSWGTDMYNVLCSKRMDIYDLNLEEANQLGKAVFERIASA